MWALYRKEVSSFLSSVIGYIVILVFLLVNGLLLWVFPTGLNVLDFGYANLDGLFVMAPFVFLFLVSAVTMRTFSDEKRTGTLEILLSKPLTEFHLIAAKYLASITLVVLALLPTLVYYYSVWVLGFPQGNIDSGSYWGSFAGLMLLAAGFASIGLFASAISDSSIVAFILSIVMGAFMYLGFEFIYGFSLFGPVDLFIRSLGISAHYSAMSRGVIDSRDLIYFFSFIGLFLALTKLVINSRKW